MTDTFVNGGRLDSGTVQHDLYTAANAGIVDVSICNQGTATVAVDLTQAPLGTADATSHYILTSYALVGNTTWFTPFPLKLVATDKLRCRSNTASVVSFKYFGIETA